MRVLLLFDQIQMGYGGKERADTPLGLEKGGVGSYLMFKDYFAQHQLQVLGTLYCGPDYFKEHKEEVLRKIAALVKKTQAQVLVCGPCVNYDTYADMAAQVADFVQKETECHTFVACSKENEEVISQYKSLVTMIEMPKKGGVGLTEALQNIAAIISQPENRDSPLIYK